METQEPHERVRRSSTDAANREIDQKTLDNIRQYRLAGPALISQRLSELDRDWDMEKLLEVNASSLALTGLALGTFVNKKWFVLPAVVTSFLLQHGLQGWCPPLPLFRKLGVRTAREIAEERTALKALRGDFDEAHDDAAGELLR